MAGQEFEAATVEFVTLAQESFKTVERRIKAGASNEAELAKSRIALAQAQLDANKAKRSKAVAFQHLSSHWGEGVPKFKNVKADFHQFDIPPALEVVLKNAANSPIAQQMSLATKAARANVDLEKSMRIPNFKIRAGARYLNANGDTGLLAGVSLPLPVFDRNQGGIAASRSRASAAGAQAEVILVEQQAELSELWFQLRSLTEQLQELEVTMLPQAQLAYKSSLALYQRGRFSYLDLLDAQRTLFEQHMQQIETLVLYHSAVAQMEAILGMPLSQLK